MTRVGLTTGCYYSTILPYNIPVLLILDVFAPPAFFTFIPVVIPPPPCLCAVNNINAGNNHHSVAAFPDCVTLIWRLTTTASVFDEGGDGDGGERGYILDVCLPVNGGSIDTVTPVPSPPRVANMTFATPPSPAPPTGGQRLFQPASAG